MTAPRPQDATRRLLATTPAPLTALAVVTSFAATLGDVELKLQYVPDRLVLTKAGFEAYVSARATTVCASLEALAATIADDVANEIVPKWSRVTVTHAGATSHSVVAEDRQPGWNHPTLLASL